MSSAERKCKSCQFFLDYSATEPPDELDAILTAAGQEGAEAMEKIDDMQLYTAALDCVCADGSGRECKSKNGHFVNGRFQPSAALIKALQGAGQEGAARTCPLCRDGEPTYCRQCYGMVAYGPLRHRSVSHE